jgi:acyl-CoA synthetase (AMP-forming)/AMP-acid ligase II
LTETTPFITIARPKHYLEKDRTTQQSYQVKTGMPNIGVRLRVVDADGNVVPADEKSIGEIVVRANHVMQGYLKDSEATNEAIVDRKKDIIISGGENISSVEVEKVLRNHPAVFEAVVIGVPDNQWGEVPKALVVLKPDVKTSEDSLIAYVKEHLANYKAPKTVEFRDELPKSGAGKILKRELREPFWAGLDKRVH